MYNRVFRRQRRLVSAGSVMLLAALYAVNGYARPDMTPLGANIADKGSAFYRFTTRNFTSADGKRRYRVWIAVPDKTPPANGFPVLYMLDGNAVMDRLSDTLLQTLSRRDPPVLIVVGYQTRLPFDLAARTYDYTPGQSQNDVSQVRDKFGRMKGGSAVFRHLLETTIGPQAEQGVKTDPARRGLWGHSYGGLFVLDAYLSSGFFTRYYSASPSLGQGYAFLLAGLKANAQADGRRLYLMEGSDSPVNQRQMQALAALREAVNAMREKGALADYQLWPGLSHGQMFNTSFHSALQQISQDEK